MTIDEIIENFALLDEWDDRYRYVIELGRSLAPLNERDRRDANKVQGCASQVWLATTVQPNGQGGPILSFVGDSDAHIVRGLIAILFALFSGKAAREILSTDALQLFDRMGLRDDDASKSWNSSHPSRGPDGGCSQADLRSTGGDGLFYCFATN